MARPKRSTPRGPNASGAAHAAHAERPSDAATGAAATSAAERAALVLWIGLIALTLARAVLPTQHTMWAWSLNLHRFMNPIWAWLPWALGAAALVPAIGRPLSAALARAGDAFGRGSALASLIAAACGATLALAFPDQVRFVGDFLIRQGTVEEIIPPGRVWPQ